MSKTNSTRPTNSTQDEFQGNIWWRPDGGPLGGLRSATPGECAQEIQRLRGILTTIFDAETRAAAHMETATDV